MAHSFTFAQMAQAWSQDSLGPPPEVFHITTAGRNAFLLRSSRLGPSESCEAEGRKRGPVVRGL